MNEDMSTDEESLTIDENTPDARNTTTSEEINEESPPLPSLPPSLLLESLTIRPSGIKRI